MIDPKELHILQHSLGLDAFGQGNSHRQHFVTGPETSDFPVCQGLVSRGLMTTKPVTFIGDSTCFLVTPEGRRFVQKHSPQPPKLTRGQERYRRWLDGASDLMSFVSWLKRGGAQ